MRCKDLFRTIYNKFREKYIFILIFIVVISIFTIFPKTERKEVLGDMSVENKIEIEDEYLQKINIEYSNLKSLSIKMDNHGNKKFSYEVSILRNGDKIISQILTDSDIKETQLYNLSFNNKSVTNKDRLEISIKKISGNNNLSIYCDDKINTSIKVDDNIISGSAVIEILYSRYGSVYKLLWIAIVTLGISAIMFIDTKKIHNSVFVIIIISGILSAIVNPILDIPDEQCHLARSELTSRGVLFLKENWEDYKISNSVKDVLDNQYKTLENTELLHKKGDNRLEHNFNNYANANIFIGYIPMTLGLIIGKIAVSLGFSSIVILFLGRFFNLLFYSVIVRYAIKIAPAFKIPLSIIAIMPMSIFIAASYNTDGVTYSLALLVISYFLYIYKKENISISQIRIFTILSIILGLVKLPYCLLGGLLIFIPRDKYASLKTYYKSIFYVGIIAIISLGWAGISVINSANSPYNQYYLDNNINSKEQLIYILNNPVRFTKNFLYSAFNNINGYLEQLSTFGWLTYNWGSGLVAIYPIFLFSTVLLYPTKIDLCKKSKVGVMIVALGIFLSTSLTLYLTWNPVGSNSLVGVQGRYFVPMIALLSLISSNKFEKDNENRDKKYIYIAFIFLFIYLISILNKYY